MMTSIGSGSHLIGCTQGIIWLVIACLMVITVVALTVAWQLWKKNHLLEARVRQDPMTGALTHTEINLRCELEVERSKRTCQSLGILELDIDHFKHINDRYGHLVGDEVLAGLVICVQQHLRMIDLFGRIGGEEFIVILPDTNAEGAVQTAERLRKSLEAYVYVTTCGELCGITVSIGATVFEPFDEHYEKNSDARRVLFKRVDDAMYEAKGAGRNRVVLWQD